MKNKNDLTIILQGGRYLPVAANYQFGKLNDVNYGVHIVLGYSHLFSNRLFAAIEQKIGYAYHPSKVKIIDSEIKNKVVKPWEFTTLARLGYGFESFPGVIYLSGGAKILKTEADDSKTFVRPVFGIGYQHALSTYWNIRGDILYTHVSSVNYKEKISNNFINCKGEGHRISGALTFVYTF
ncbi:MAG: hypothetical protein IJT36_09160 [Alphaproteobacteria bacterium]|nr:hypothetical protein [Alphaproteobacteria bacterium]